MISEFIAYRAVSITNQVRICKIGS